MKKEIKSLTEIISRSNKQEETMKKKVALHNLGCKVNAYEVEAMQQLLEEAGYEIVPFEPGADVYLINTCTVTNIADRKSRQMLHKAKKMNPDAIVIAAGCYVQTDEGKLDKDEAVDLILGNNQKGNIVQVLEEYEQQHTRQKHVLKIKYRTAAISSVPTVSFPMQEEESEAVKFLRLWTRYVHWLQEATKKSY